MSVEYCFKHHHYWDTDYFPYCYLCDEEDEELIETKRQWRLDQ